MNRRKVHLAQLAAVATLLVAASGLAAESTNVEGLAAPSPRQTVDARLDRLRTTLATGSDLRMRLLFSYTRDDVGADEGPAVWRDIVPVATLYDEARGSTDPLVLELLLDRCGLPTATAPACDRVDVARRLTVADTQNQAAWLALADELSARNDVDGARATVLRAAEASRWHEYTWDLMRLVAHAAPTDLSPEERLAWLNEAVGRAVAARLSGAQSIWSVYTTQPALRGDTALRDACLRILDTVARDGETLTTLLIASGSAQKLGAPPHQLAALRQRGDALRWALQAESPDALDAPTDADAATMARHSARLQDIVDHTERERAERVFVATHIGEAEAARRYVTSLSPEMRARHDTPVLAAWAVPAVSAGSARSTAASP